MQASLKLPLEIRGAKIFHVRVDLSPCNRRQMQNNCLEPIRGQLLKEFTTCFVLYPGLIYLGVGRGFVAFTRYITFLVVDLLGFFPDCSFMYEFANLLFIYYPFKFILLPMISNYFHRSCSRSCSA
jgi:hypothetical protein